jgi:hypothetical protein
VLSVDAHFLSSSILALYCTVQYIRTVWYPADEKVCTTSAQIKYCSTVLEYNYNSVLILYQAIAFARFLLLQFATGVEVYKFITSFTCSLF